MEKVLVTGARSGIINKVIDKIINDYYIYLTVHTQSELKIVKEKYKNYPNVECLKLDVTKDLDKVKNLGVDILISNAAISETGSVLEIDMDKVRDNFEVNVFSNFSLVQIVLKNMLKKGNGKIIMMGSLAGKIPLPFAGPYSASKASIIKLTEALNLELKLINNNIKIVLILPGLYKTGFNKLMFDKKYDDKDFIKYFDYHLKLIRNSENLVLSLFEKKKLDKIVNKIVKAVKSDNPKFIYSTPMYQYIFSKFFN